MDLPRGKKKLSGDIKDINSILRNLPQEFKGAARIFMKIKGTLYEGDILIQNNSIIATSLENLDIKKTISGERAFEEIKSMIKGATGALDVYSFTDDEIKLTVHVNDETLLESPIGIDRIIEEPKIEQLEKKEVEIEEARVRKKEEEEKKRRAEEESKKKKEEEARKRMEGEAERKPEEDKRKEETKREIEEEMEGKEEGISNIGGLEELEEEWRKLDEEWRKLEKKEKSYREEIVAKEEPEKKEVIEKVEKKAVVIPKLKKKIGFMDRLHFMTSPQTLKVLKAIDGKKNLEEISKETGIDISTLNKLIGKLVIDDYVTIKSK